MIEAHKFLVFDFPALALKHSYMGHWCGYVGVPNAHGAYGLDYNHPRLRAIRVHGGLTYAGPGFNEAFLGDFWWLGFDCAHWGDYIPALPQTAAPGLENIRNLDYIIKECQTLGEQLESVLMP